MLDLNAIKERLADVDTQPHGEQQLWYASRDTVALVREDIPALIAEIERLTTFISGIHAERMRHNWHCGPDCEFDDWLLEQLQACGVPPSP